MDPPEKNSTESTSQGDDEVVPPVAKAEQNATPKPRRMRMKPDKKPGDIKVKKVRKSLPKVEIRERREQMIKALEATKVLNPKLKLTRGLSKIEQGCVVERLDVFELPVEKEIKKTVEEVAKVAVHLEGQVDDKANVFEFPQAKVLFRPKIEAPEGQVEERVTNYKMEEVDQNQRDGLQVLTSAAKTQDQAGVAVPVTMQTTELTPVDAEAQGIQAPEDKDMAQKLTVAQKEKKWAEKAAKPPKAPVKEKKIQAKVVTSKPPDKKVVKGVAVMVEEKVEPEEVSKPLPGKLKIAQAAPEPSEAKKPKERRQMVVSHKVNKQGAQKAKLEEAIEPQDAAELIENKFKPKEKKKTGTKVSKETLRTRSVEMADSYTQTWHPAYERLQRGRLLFPHLFRDPRFNKVK